MVFVTGVGVRLTGIATMSSLLEGLLQSLILTVIVATLGRKLVLKMARASFATSISTVIALTRIKAIAAITPVDVTIKVHRFVDVTIKLTRMLAPRMLVG